MRPPSWTAKDLRRIVALRVEHNSFDVIGLILARAPQSIRAAFYGQPVCIALRRKIHKRIMVSRPSFWTDARLREAITLYFVQKKSFEECAKIFGRDSAWSTRSQLYTKRSKRLRREMGVLERRADAHASLAGKRFGRLRVIRRYGRRGNGRTWLCHCKCGNRAIVSTTRLVSEKRDRCTRSCGCLRLESIKSDGQYSKQNKYTNNSYYAMLTRCLNEKSNCYENYGKNGIKVCQRWQGPDGFKYFVEDMGRRPKDRSLDRKNPHLHYSCGHCEQCLREGWEANCRWATDKQQNNNKRTSPQWKDYVSPAPELDDLGNELNPF